MEKRHVRVAHVTTVDMSLRLLLLDQMLGIQKAGYDVTAVSAAGPDVAAVERAGIPHIAVPFTRTMTPLKDLRALAKLVRIFRRERFDIVHTHTPKAGLLGQLAARIAGVPIIINTIHGFYFHEHMRPAARTLHITAEKIAARCSTAILSQNPEDIATAIAEGIAPRDRIEILGNGIDLSRFSPTVVRARRDAARRSLGLAPDALVIGFVGRLVAEKGLLELVTAVRAVRARFPQVRCVLVGPMDHAKADAIDPLALTAGDDTFVITGARDDMPEMYSAMDIFVLPSHREGFPRSAMEAAAMGLPCIVTDVRGCRETVRHGVTGLLFPLRDADALTGAILTLLENAETRAAMGREGRALAEQEFDQRRVLRRVLDLYERTLA